MMFHPLWYLLVISLLNSLVVAAELSNTTTITFTNHADIAFEVYWIDESSPGSLVPLGPPVEPESSTSVESYSGHQFLFRLVPHIPGVETIFTRGKEEEEVFVIYNNATEVLRAHTAQQFHSIRRSVRIGLEMAARNVTKRTLQQPRQIRNTSNLLESVDLTTSHCSNLRGNKFVACMASNLVDDIVKATKTKIQRYGFRDAMSYRLRNYTCADDSMQTSAPVFSYDLPLADRNVQVDVLLNKSHSKIWTVNDFISDAECDILQKHGKPLLIRATVTAEDGTSVMSEHRKANHAGYELTSEHDPLWPLYNRVLQMTNHHTGFDLKPPGQEAFTIIQYNKEDQYTPHCDGSCDNSMHIPTGRVATGLLYCQAPVRGGGTTFSKSDIFVVPKRGQATFFSYKGPDGRMDDGYTEHSGCPVLDGEKWVVTLWMREGVSLEHPSYLYDPAGRRILDKV